MKESPQIVTSIKPSPTGLRQRSTGARIGRSIAGLGRVIYLLGTILLAGSIALQVFFAGAGVLVDPGYWAMHRAFGETIISLGLVLLLIGIVAWLPWRMQALNMALVVLLPMQFVFLWTLGQALGVPALRALHAMNALALFWLTVHLARGTGRLLRAPRRDQAIS